MMPVYQTFRNAFKKDADVTVVVNFASFRSVHSSVMVMMNESRLEEIDGSQFIDHLLRYIEIPSAKVLVVWGRLERLMTVPPATS
jgi:hypothetical protein